MPFQISLKRLYFFIGGISWLLLLTNILLISDSIQAQTSTTTPRYLNNLLSAIFIISVFQFQRRHVESLRGVEFIGYLWKLFARAGVFAYFSAFLHIGYYLLSNYLDDDLPYVLQIIYQVNFALLTYFLAKSFYVWRQMILFQKTKFLVAQWTWFEILIFSTLLLTLLNIDVMNYIFFPLLVLMGVYTLFICINLKWVAYLTLNKKWHTIFLLSAILVSVFIFSKYFQDLSGSEYIIFDYAYMPFLLLVKLFVFLYSLASLLVAIFSLPTSSVFEQKQEELLSFQRLSQSIQQGQSESQVYDMLFDCAINAATADAAWFDVNQANNTPATTHTLNIDQPHIKRIRQMLKDYNIDNFDYINNNLDHNPNFRELSLPWKSLIVVPLKHQKRIYGTIYLLKEIEQGFDRDTVGVLRTFTNQTILTIENLRLLEESIQNEVYKEELKIASQVQDSLIPKKFPTDTWFEISTFSKAAKEVGGDFFDFIQLKKSRIAIIIGDVSGKGISAAFHMAQMKGIFHGLMQLDYTPDEFMVMANDALSRCLDRSSFITCSLYVIDYEQKGVSFARAGHCHTLYHNCMTEDTFYFQSEGLGLGIIRDKSYVKHIHKMYYDYNPGDVMVIYTDGIVEARNKKQEEYGEERLKYIVSQTYHLEAEDIKWAIINDVNAFSDIGYLHDDETLLVLKFKNV
ncbi:MAG: SpoIIE family protein phosphatase [Hymenobacteraceae bacterium]|nr:SpoIIE family protein phosphatase [Hymenobacteraceae bacterium]